MTESDKETATAFNSALQKHEEGHVLIAEDYMKGKSKTFHIEGTTRKRVQDDMKRALRDYKKEVGSSLDERTKEYDNVTDHGRRQDQGRPHGFPDTPNTTLDCPPAPPQRSQPRLKELRTPAQMRKGETKKGEVILDRPALSGGCAVTLTSNRWLAVPGLVTVDAGETSTDFRITATGPDAGVTVLRARLWAPQEGHRS
jgi:hypothetical protein